tara:strand:- start:316 stop:657 length:342 start_codon:yes stop_codon:yes gene_type:complete
MLKITDKAKNKLLQILEKEKLNSMLLYIKGGGCNGFSYKFKPINKNNITKLDEKIILDQQLQKNLYICNKSLMYIIGTRIDYIEDIMGSRFDFNNDNIESKCGCGTSFTLSNI